MSTIIYNIRESEHTFTMTIMEFRVPWFHCMYKQILTYEHYKLSICGLCRCW